MISAGRHPVAVNPLHFMATEDGWFDFGDPPPEEEILDAVAGAGFGAVQTAPAAGVPAAVHRRRLAAAGLRPGPGYAALTWSPGARPRVAEADRVRALAHDLAACGCTLAFMGLDVDPDGERMRHPARGWQVRDAGLEEIADFVGEAAAAMRAEGVVAALHPHVGTWIESPQEATAVLERAGDALAFGPDTGHLAWAGADLPALLHRHRARVAGLHVKDLSRAVAEAAHAEGLDYRATVARGLWREPGDGDLELTGLVAGLGADDDCWIVIEVDHSSLDPRTSLARSAAWVRGLDAVLTGGSVTS
ncbi:sugar phosphate isomerase/epimerase family protein [Streptomyces sp. NPDC002125]